MRQALERLGPDSQKRAARGCRFRSLAGPILNRTETGHVAAVDSQIQILGKALDDIETFGQRRAALEPKLEAAWNPVPRAYASPNNLFRQGPERCSARAKPAGPSRPIADHRE